MRLGTPQRLVNTAIWIVIACGALTVGVASVASLRWEFAQDTPLLQYAGLLIVEFGMVPYRDFFETSMPGTYAFHALIVFLFGAGNLAFALVNLGYLSLVLVAAWLFLSRIDRVVASGFAAWYALSYMATGPTVIMQRDFLTELPIATAMALVAWRRPRAVNLRALMIGVLFGMAATVKPQLALGAPLVVLADTLIDGWAWRPAVLTILASLAGFAIPIGAALTWIVAVGAWPFFLDLVTGYLPLYLGQTGEHVFLPREERLRYLFWNGIIFGWYWRQMLVALLAGAIALWLCRRDRTRTVLVGLAMLMMVLYGLIPILGGQFWNYHYLPLAFFLFMTLGLLLLPLRAIAAAPRLALVAGVALIWSLHNNLTYQDFPQLGPNEAQGGRVARIVTALSMEMKPGDSVQPLDGTEGVIHAMLRLQIPIATPFFFDWLFYHDIHSPVTQMFRRRFLEAMDRAKPTFLVEATRRPKYTGVDTAPDFPDFDRLVAANYHVVHEEDDFRILKRNQ